MDKLVSKKIYFKIERAKNILLVTHQRADGDALGSAFALAEFLDNLGKDYRIFCQNSPFLDFWGFSRQRVVSDVDQLANFDLIITLDSSDLKFAGLQEGVENKLLKTIINIDHHFSNTNFGEINLVDSRAAATSEIIYGLFLDWRAVINKNAATYLLLGIVTDTNYFSNPNTTFECLKIAAELLSRGASWPQINNSVLKNKTLDTLKLWGRVFSRLNFNRELGVASAVITLKDLEDFKVADEALEGVANFLNNLSGVKVSMVLKEQPDGTIKGSLRTNDDLIDLTEIAKILGGGGHKKAAGFTIKGKLAETEQGWRVV